MLNSKFAVLMLLALVAAIPAVSEAGRRKRCCCNVCQQPACVCPQAVPQTTLQPVYETQYVPQAVMTERDVVETQYRSEAVNETVPTTAYENVTVDEGSYQSVWVPRVTTKQVAKTVYQQRTSYRTVPYQVTRRVSEYQTRSVPQQTVRYVPTTTNTLAYTAAPGVGYAAAPSYGTPYAPMTAYNAYPSYPVQAPIATATPWFGSGPAVASAPVYGQPSSPIYNSAPVPANSGMVPQPDPVFSQNVSTPIQPRTADRFGGYQPATTASSDTGPALQQADRSSSMFVPAPSAAQVWRTPRGSVTR